MIDRVRYLIIFYDFLLWMTSELLNKIPISKDGFFYKAVSITASTVAIISTILLTVFFKLYKHTIDKYLKHTLKENYEGIIFGTDALTFLIDDNSTIHHLYYVKSKKSGDEFAKEITSHLQEKFKEDGYKKLLTSRKKFMGYLYNRRCNLNVEEFVKVVKCNGDELNHKKLLEILENCINKPMPNENKFNFDCFIITSQIDGKYVIIIRMHHSLVDGVTMYNLSTNLLCQKTENKNEYAKYLSKIKDISKESPTYTKKPVTRVIFNSFYTSREKHNTKLTIFADPTNQYYEKIKNIMKKYKVRFHDVVSSAISFSVSKSFQENNDKNIYVISPRQVNISRMVNNYENQELCQYGNDFAAYYYKIPSGNKINYIKRLEDVSAELHEIHKTNDFWIMRAMLNLMKSYPIDLFKIIFGVQGVPIAFTNFPGGPKLKLFNGDTVEDTVMTCPITPGIGIAVCLYTYDDRIQLSVSTNKARHNKMNGFIDDFLKYLDELSEHQY